MPVLPPTAASTAPSSVVGTLTHGMPRLNVAATKPPRSVTTPPPTLTISDLRVAPLSMSVRQTRVAASMFLASSPASTVITVAPCSESHSCNRRGRAKRAVLVSAITKTPAGSISAITLSRASSTRLVNRIFSFIVEPIPQFMLTQGGQLLSRFVVKVKELWGSITTEPKRRRCQKMAAMAVTSSGRGFLMLNSFICNPEAYNL